MKRNQARLRLVTVDGGLVGPRRYAQSTSGRSESHGTAPPDSRSSAIAIDSPMRPPTDKRLRKYPMVVPQRCAYLAWSSGERVFKYSRSLSMPDILPIGHTSSIPTGHLPAGYAPYPDDMDVQEIRRKRLRQLVSEYGTQTALADKVGIEQNYISRALKGTKRIGEDFAAKLETATEKPSGWMSRIEKPGADWPFEFDRRHWDNLPAEERAQLELSFMRMVLGAEADLARRRKPKKTG